MLKDKLANLLAEAEAEYEAALKQLDAAHRQLKLIQSVIVEPVQQKSLPLMPYSFSEDTQDEKRKASPPRNLGRMMAVVNYLKEKPEGENFRQVAEGLGVREASVSPLLSVMYLNGFIGRKKIPLKREMVYFFTQDLPDEYLALLPEKAHDIAHIDEGFPNV